MINKNRFNFNHLLYIKYFKENILKIFFVLLWFIFFIPAFYRCYIIDFDTLLIFKRFTEFYPLLFLPLFIKKRIKIINYFNYIIIGLLFTGLLYGKYLDYMHLYSIFQIYLGLYLLSFLGIFIHPAGYFLFLMVPQFTDKYSLLFGFQLRLFLTKAATSFLSLFYSGVESFGNTIKIKGNAFTIGDPCDGLNMLVAIILLLLLLYYKMFNNRKAVIKNIILFALFGIISIVLWILTNLIRIIVLVVWNIPPESILHQGIGILLFTGIVIIPVVLLYNKFFVRERIEKNIYSTCKYNIKTGIVLLIIVCFVLIISFKTKAVVEAWPYSINNYFLDNQYKIEEKYSEIASFHSSDSIMIIKRNLTPFRILHHPKQCWVGSGYKFSEEEEVNINDFGKVNKTILLKNENKYYLYWWYQPVSGKGNNCISNEIKYRLLSLLKMKKYIQVNVFFYDENYDLESLKEIINYNFKPYF